MLTFSAQVKLSLVEKYLDFKVPSSYSADSTPKLLESFYGSSQFTKIALATSPTFSFWGNMATKKGFLTLTFPTLLHELTTTFNLIIKYANLNFDNYVSGEISSPIPCACSVNSAAYTFFDCQAVKNSVLAGSESSNYVVLNITAAQSASLTCNIPGILHDATAGNQALEYYVLNA